MLTDGRTWRAYANTSITVFGTSIEQICTRFIVPEVSMNWDRTEGPIHQRHVMIIIPNFLSTLDHISLVNRLVQFNVFAPVCECLSFLGTDDKNLRRLSSVLLNCVPSGGMLLWWHGIWGPFSYDLHSCHETLRNLQSVFQDTGCLNLGLK